MNISGVTSSLGHSGHMALTSKPQNLSKVQNESVGGGKIESPTEPLSFGSDKAKLKPALKKAGSVDESPQKTAAKWNKKSSTLILKGPSNTGGSQQPSGRGKGRRSHSVSEPERRRDEAGSLSSPDGVVATPASAPLSSRSFSFEGLSQAPGHLHLAAK